jgi:hypothetical protein
MLNDLCFTDWHSLAFSKFRPNDLRNSAPSASQKPYRLFLSRLICKTTKEEHSEET